MHPQHMQSSSVLHLPLVTAMTGQVKVSVVNFVLRHTKFGHGGLQDVHGVYQGQNVFERSSTFLLPPTKRMHQKSNQIHLGSSTFRNESKETQAIEASNNTY